MKRRQGWLGAVMLVGASVLAVGQVLGGDEVPKTEGKGAGDAAMEAWMKLAQPGDFHAHLKPLVGKWTTASKWRMTPEMPWDESKGTAEYTWLLGGRFLQQKIVGEMEEGGRFEGIGFWGYDNGKKKYTSIWMETMGTMIAASEGTCDASGKIFNMTGQYFDPMANANKEMKTILRIINNDKHVFEWFDADPDGKPFQALEVTYTRQ